MFHLTSLNYQTRNTVNSEVLVHLQNIESPDVHVFFCIFTKADNLRFFSSILDMKKKQFQKKLLLTKYSILFILSGIYILDSNMLVCFVVLNATFNNISVISWRSVLWVEETGGTVLPCKSQT
jgi:hypothetical protein